MIPTPPPLPDMQIPVDTAFAWLPQWLGWFGPFFGLVVAIGVIGLVVGVVEHFAALSGMVKLSYGGQDVMVSRDVVDRAVARRAVGKYLEGADNQQALLDEEGGFADDYDDDD